MGSTEDLRRTFESEALPHLNAAYSFARVLTGQPNEAEDLVQDTYVRALQFFHKFQQGSNCKAWLFTIMKRIFLNQAPQRAREVLCPLQGESPDADATESMESHLGQAAGRSFGREEVFRQDVVHALDLLPHPFRAVVVLRDLEGFTYNEIAEVLNCPIGTVMSRLSRGRELLRDMLSAYNHRGEGSRNAKVIHDA